MSAPDTISPRMTERARKVLDVSLREALAHGQNYIGTEHLLLALLRDHDSLASEALTSIASEEKIRNEVMTRLLGERRAEKVTKKEAPTTPPKALDVAKEMVREVAEVGGLDSHAIALLQALALVAVAEELGGAEI